MRLTELELETVAIPFRHPFEHASAVRQRTSGVWIRARSATGRVGYGEGCPRPYVTGEDVASATAFFERHRPSLLAKVSDLESLRRWMQWAESDIDDNPAAWCAVELALLDLMSRERGCSVEMQLGLPELEGPFRYSAVLGAGDAGRFANHLARYLELGLADFKVKLSGVLEQDRRRLADLHRCAPPGARVRLDANNLWRSPPEAAEYLAALEQRFFAVEEPLEAGDLSGLCELTRLRPELIVLDESLLRRDRVEELGARRKSFILNLRISKMGGLMRSLGVLDAARSCGLGVIVGAHVGETSLLTRAALAVASGARDVLVAQEGAFGTLLLEYDPFAPSLVFGRQGILQPPSADSGGFGLQPAGSGDQP